MPTIIPAILTDTIEDFKAMVATINHVAAWIHIDIADGQFVTSRTVQLKDITSISRQPKTEIHLMVEEPENCIDETVAAQAELVLFHLEAVKSPEKAIERAKAKNLQVGLVLNPQTEINQAIQYDAQVDIIQLMGVPPGNYGRPFIPKTIDRLRVLHQKLRHAMLAVDGGINAENIVDVAKTGVDRIVVGSAIFGSDNPRQAYQDLKKRLAY